MESSATSEQRPYKILPVAAGDEDEIMDLLKRTFFIDEPLNEAVNLYENGSCPEVEEYSKESLLKGLSFKAVAPDEKIVGVIINGICPLKEENENDTILSQAMRCTNPKFQKILHIIAKREEGAKLSEKFPNEKFLVDVKVAATDPKWRRKGIMNELVRETENAVIEQGIRILRMDTSSAYSAMSAERLGFTCVYRALYKDMEVDGKPLIIPQEPHIEDRVNIKILPETTKV